MRCDHCGNDQANTFQIVAAGRTMNFDAFECAIDALAPRCGHCECLVTGHGVEADGFTYCSNECADAHVELGAAV